MDSFTLGYNDAANEVARAGVKEGSREKAAHKLGFVVTGTLAKALGSIEYWAGKIAYWSDADLPCATKLRSTMIITLRDTADKLERKDVKKAA